MGDTRRKRWIREREKREEREEGKREETEKERIQGKSEMEKERGERGDRNFS